MTSTSVATLERALEQGVPVEGVLDLVDEAIEQAAAVGDAETLGRLSRRLDAVATERGGGWSALGIAGTRAGVLAARVAPGQSGAVEPSLPVPPGPLEPLEPVAPVGRVTAAPLAQVAQVEPVTAVPAVATASSATTDGVVAEPTRAYAGWWIRALAYLIDLVVLGVVYGFISVMPGSDSALAGFVYFALPLVYFVGMHSYANGATLGKAVVAIRVEAVDEGPVNLGRALGRALVTTGLWISSVGGFVDLIVLAVDRRKQSVHDKAAGTIVRHAPRRPRASA